MILVTGATGQFGSKAVEHLLKKGVEPSTIAVLVRDSNKAKDLERGIAIREGDYTDRFSMVEALTGVDNYCWYQATIEKRLKTGHSTIKTQ